MKSYQKALLIVVSMALLCLVHAAAQATGEGARSSLSGTVSWVAQEGTVLPAGGEIVRIKTLTGEAAAARVEERSEIISVAVAPGDEITAGMVVAQVRPAEVK